METADRGVRSVEDLLRLLDGLFADGGDRWSEAAAGWWDDFYADRDRPVPFFADKPDESLAGWVADGTIPAGRALDLGCGPGRNAVHLAGLGFAVDAVDLSPAAVAWGRDRARAAGVDVDFRCADAFGGGISGPYDLVYDSGCFHHLPPHRRISYLALLERVLAPGGWFGLTCFAAGAMGSETPDAELYRRGRLEGGLAYSAEQLRHIFSSYSLVQLRRVRADPAYFGEEFLWTALYRKPVTGAGIPAVA
ncbi:class I SAM-dependent methyltransferase [Dactylosporangium sp. CA-139066]|uniref:class I SAM-dependent methyltransferase n=1 Tax=Dactylosporangium sp. CA-139066 TaxID=3239930 RepID=UPI003D914DAA